MGSAKCRETCKKKIKKKYTYFGGLGFNLGNESVLGWKPKNYKIYRDCGSRNGHFLRLLEVVCRTIA